MAMKFIPLDGKKDPPANTLMIISFKDGDWVRACLKKIEFSDKGKEYVFAYGEDEYTDATHYLLIEPPKTNQ